MLCTLASFATVPALAANAARAGLLAQNVIVPPAAIVVLCCVAGIGTLFMLPGNREPSWTKIGAVLALAAGVIFIGMLAHWAGSDENPEHGGMSLYYWIFSIIAVFSAVRVVTHPRPVYAALYFVLTVAASAGLFVLLWAEFMAAALIVIYAGAILVTYVFVIMLAQQSRQAQPGDPPLAGLAEYDRVSRDPVIASVIGFGLMGVLMFVIFDRAEQLHLPSVTPAVQATIKGGAPPDLKAEPAKDTPLPQGEITAAPKQALPVVSAPAYDDTTQSLGVFLFQDQLFNVELAGLILTISMVGAIVIARRRIVGSEGFETVGETLTGPATPVDDDPHSIPVYGTTNPSLKAYPET